MRKKEELRPAQDRAITAMYESSAVQAVMPMGAGKTAVAMTAAAELLRDGEIEAVLVLAPKRVAQLVWTKEHKLWEHLKHLKICLVTGTPAKRLKLLQEADADIFVMGMDNTQWLVELLEKAPDDSPLFDLLIVDESSRFKNPRSKRGRALQKIASRFRNMWMLTGTPRPNGYEDQFRPMQLLTKEKLWPRSFDSWRTKHFMKVDADGEPSEYGFAWAIRPEHEPRIKEEISRYSFTVGDEDLPDVPDPIPVFHWIDLPPDAQAKYKSMEKHLLAEFEREYEDGIKVVMAANAAVASGKLAQIANGFMYDEAGDVEWIHDEKYETLMDLVVGLDADPYMIGYEFKEDLARIRKMWGDIRYFGAGISDAQAFETEKLWNDRRLDRIAIHPASGGHGLNLQYGGRQIIWYSMPWSAELYDQTNRRIARPGQTKQVYAHHILARNTVDEVKYDRVIGKMSMQEAFRKYLRSI